MKYLPLYSFPSAAWLAEASTVDVILDVHEYYEKQTPRNRFEILGVNGILSLSIPVVGQKGEKVMSKDIRIAEHDWRKKHLTSIRSSYGSAPFFEFYFDELSDIFLKRQEFLIDFNMEALNWLRSKKIPVSNNLSTEFLPFDQKEKITPIAIDEPPRYLQVFSDRFNFQSGLSSIDVLMNLGPRAADHILLWKNGK